MMSYLSFFVFLNKNIDFIFENFN